MSTLNGARLLVKTLRAAGVEVIYGPDRRVASDLLETRYDEVARALGGEGGLIECPEQLGPALDGAFAGGRPTVLNARIASIPSPAAAAGWPGSSARILRAFTMWPGGGYHRRRTHP